MGEEKIRIGITHGDINGVGYEVIIKTLIESHIIEMCTPVVYGSPKVAAYHRKALNIENFNFNIIRKADEAHDKRPNIINCVDEEIRVELGKSTPAAGEAAFLALDAAVNDLKAGKIHAIVTAPINKHNIQSENFRFSGHTEFFQSMFGPCDVLMLMVGSMLKVGVVAGHVPIKDLHEYIVKDRILAKIRILNNSLIHDFTVRRPKIAVLGFNPHAGDNGLLGDEEQSEIIPAIQEQTRKISWLSGPTRQMDSSVQVHF